MMNGEELTSTEARILKDQIQDIGTTFVRSMQEFRDSVNGSLADQAELIGGVLREVGGVRTDVRDVKLYLGLEGKGVKLPRPAPVPTAPQPPPARKHRHHLHSLPGTDRPSFPPSFAAEEKEIEVTDTGSFHIPPGTLERISKRVQELEDEKKLAEAATEGKEELRLELEKANKKLADRIKLVIAIGGAAVGAVAAVAAVVVWTIQHVH